MEKRETFGSRLGFILISAGCAIGLGNVWRFPYITAQYGGAAFILLYLVALLILGIPIMTMEFTVGRGSKQNIIRAYTKLGNKGKKTWGAIGKLGVLGNYFLMMFYTVITGWMLTYIVKMIKGEFVGLESAEVANVFGTMAGTPSTQIIAMCVVTVLGFIICGIGLQNGIERVTKVMMIALLAIMVILAIRSVSLPGAEVGLAYYLKPDFSLIFGSGWKKFMEILFAAVGQAFFTLSIGMGSMEIFGSYIGKERSLYGESITITILDTLVAVIAGLIIIPACFAYDIPLDAGPNLVFITLPNIFNAMPLGRLWGALFFVFMLFAALSTLVAVFETIMSAAMDSLGWSRKKAAIVNCAAIMVLSLPTVFGFNIWSGFQPLGEGTTVLDLLDFIISQNLQPLGSLACVLFCTTKLGWGWDSFIEEANCGKGLKLPVKLRKYYTIVIPMIIVYVFVMGYIGIFG